MKTIQLNKVGKAYGRSWALNRVTTRFDAGRLVALLGPNGAGKSTLLSIVATLLRPDHGEVLYDDMPQKQAMRTARRSFGYVSHDALLYLDLTGRENLRFYSDLYGLEDRSRIDRLLEQVDLVKAADKIVRGYSRGMRQRLSIARALLQKPTVLLLDEPFTGLDRWGEESVQAILAAQRDAGHFVLLSTHRLNFPVGFCDEVRVLKRGRMLVDRAIEPGEQPGEIYASAVEGKEDTA